MTTIENIHSIIEKKIELAEAGYNFVVRNITGIEDSLLERNLKTISIAKEKLDYSIEDYLISSAYYLHSYKILISDNTNESLIGFINNSKPGVIDISLIMELLHIFRSNEYSYKSKKTFGNVDNRHKKRKVYEAYKAYVRGCNINDFLNLFMRDLYHFNEIYSKNEEFTKNYIKYTKIHFSLGKDNEVIYDVCDCGSKMIVQSSTSELLCFKCGYTVNLIGSVIEDSQLFAQEGNRVSHGSYDPARHCKFWIERIQAKENTIIPQESIDKIKKSIQRDYPDCINYKNITVKQFRSYLKQNNLSKLNDHIPLIKKIITGHVPPQLNFKEHQLLFIYFDKAARTYDKIKPVNKKNSLYYPFLIYKILELIIDSKDKKEKLLNCIHLQSYETLIDNDRIWFDICNQNDCFKYMATDRSD